MSPKLISVSRALQRYSIGRTKFYELIAAGDIRAVKLGSKTLIDLAAADAYFESLPQPSSARGGSLRNSASVRVRKMLGNMA